MSGHESAGGGAGGKGFVIEGLEAAWDPFFSFLGRLITCFIATQPPAHAH